MATAFCRTTLGRVVLQTHLANELSLGSGRAGCGPGVQPRCCRRQSAAPRAPPQSPRAPPWLPPAPCPAPPHHMHVVHHNAVRAVGRYQDCGHVVAVGMSHGTSLPGRRRVRAVGMSHGARSAQGRAHTPWRRDGARHRHLTRRHTTSTIHPAPSHAGAIRPRVCLGASSSTLATPCDQRQVYACACAQSCARVFVCVFRVWV